MEGRKVLLMMCSGRVGITDVTFNNYCRVSREMIRRRSQAVKAERVGLRGGGVFHVGNRIFCL